MRAIGVVLIVVGLVLGCVQLNYAFQSEIEQQSYEDKYADYRDEADSYYQRKAVNPNVRYPAYPREAKWSENDLLLWSIAAYGPWVFLGGCALFVGGVVRAHHLELCKILGQMTARLSPKSKPDLGKDTTVRRPEADPSAVAAMNDMAHSSQPVPQASNNQESHSESPPLPPQGGPGAPKPRQEPQIQKQRNTPEPIFWMPDSYMGILLLFVWLIAVGYAASQGRGEGVDVVVALIFNYVIIMSVRWFAFARPKHRR